MKKLISMVLMMLMFIMPAAVNADGWQYITIAEGAELGEYEGEYPATLTMGAQQFDPLAVLSALGEDWTYLGHDDYMNCDEYRSAGGDEPWEYKHGSVYCETGTLWYYDPMIVSERGAEYEAPHMDMLPSESLSAMKALLNGAVDESWLRTPDPISAASNRWNFEADRWFTDAEYSDFFANVKSHYFIFAHLSQYGLPIRPDRVYTQVGVNGLATLELDWREWSESEECIAPMPLEEAINMANSTRERDTVLFYAGLVYSDWLTDDGTCNLCWYLLTSNGNYVVDCVLKKHMCDSYEY